MLELKDADLQPNSKVLLSSPAGSSTRTRVAEVVKVFKWKRRVVGFTAVAKKRSFRVLLLFGGDGVEKL